MKKKHLVTSLAVMTIMATGVVGAIQPASANEPTVSEQKADGNTPAFKEAYLEHYNVLRIELAEPFDASNAYLQLQHGNYITLGQAVIIDNKTVAYDINLDEFAKANPTKEEKDEIVKSLHLRYITYDGLNNKQIKINDQFVRKTLKNAKDQGTMLPTGSVGVATNLKKLGSYNKIITQEGHATYLLNNKVTTETGSIGFKVNTDYKEGYDYSVTDEEGNESGVVMFHDDNMFVKSESGKFLAQEYTIKAINKKTGKVLNIAKFTPFNIF